MMKSDFEQFFKFIKKERKWGFIVDNKFLLIKNQNFLLASSHNRYSHHLFFF